MTRSSKLTWATKCSRREFTLQNIKYFRTS